MLVEVTETCTFSAIHLEVPVVTDVLALAVELAVEFGKEAALIAAARRRTVEENMTGERR